MRYKTLITEKLQQVVNGTKRLKYYAERGIMDEYRYCEEGILDKIEEIQTLINTQDEIIN